MNAVTVKNLTKVFRQGDEDIYAVDHVSFTVAPGEMVAIVGQSGSGKTTLLNLIGGVEHPTSGSVEVGGVDICSADDETLSGIRRRKLGYIFQDFNLIPILTAEENIIMPLLLEDQAFYKKSGGGVTISGGEPLMQSQFCAEILKRLKSYGINTAVDTCGFAARADFDRVVPFTDTFLYDLKAYDEQVHIRCTGKSNRIILENLKYLDEKGKKIEVRIPYIPGLTSGEILNLGLFLKDIKSVNKVRLLAYHCAESKYRAIGLSYTPLDLKRPSKGEMLEAAKALRRIGLNAVYGAD